MLKLMIQGAYDNEETEAHAYDLAALKYWGQDTIINFPLSNYEKELIEMESQSREEYIGSLIRKSSGFSRGVSKYILIIGSSWIFFGEEARLLLFVSVVVLLCCH
ncbi:hypothetical protein P8452_65816 [Trifolium repens]|nr:hypothetical protein P8452_65816 [Trifolium repens]